MFHSCMKIRQSAEETSLDQPERTSRTISILHFHDKQSKNVNGFCVKKNLQEIGTYTKNFQVSENPKTGKTPECILEFISMFVVICSPRRVLGWFYNCLIWKVILLFGLPEGAKWNNKFPTELVIWKLGYQRTAPESETARVIQVVRVWSESLGTGFGGGGCAVLSPLHWGARTGICREGSSWTGKSLCLEAHHGCSLVSKTKMAGILEKVIQGLPGCNYSLSG